ncbi:MAG: hypothetical protein LBH98_04160, partial [Chitinispirillales bacterium]|jgi:hypothetical protein|nr:hypothetical protein [Chitinispirillales bacterium]
VSAYRNIAHRLKRRFKIKYLCTDGNYAYDKVNIAQRHLISLCFVAYKVYKEFERILKIKNIDLSVDKIINIAKTITTLKIKLPTSGETISKTMQITQKHKSIALLFDENFWSP